MVVVVKRDKINIIKELVVHDIDHQITINESSIDDTYYIEITPYSKKAIEGHYISKKLFNIFLKEALEFTKNG